VEARFDSAESQKREVYIPVWFADHSQDIHQHYFDERCGNHPESESLCRNEDKRYNQS
jgi:hypothetical protein